MALVDQINSLATRLGSEIKALTSRTVPTATVLPFAGTAAPNGFLFANGAAVSRSTYPDLFAAFGTAYGTGNGSTTFNLPDLRGKVPNGIDSSQTEFTPLGKTGGAKTHTLTAAQIPAHTHPGFQSTGYAVGGAAAAVHPSAGSAYNIPANTGGGQAHNNLQPYIVLNYIIKT